MFALGGLVLHYSPLRLLAEIAAVVAVLLAVSPRFRRVARGTPGSPVAFFACATVAAAWMSLGPVMHANGREIGPGLYAVLYRWVPAFNGLRVVSLNFMLVALFLAVLAGLGAAALLRRWPAAGRLIVAAGSIAILAESASTSIVTGVPAPGPIYAVVRTLPAGTVLAEFPFGNVTAEIEYTFFAGLHRKPIVNGYSGFFPERYVTLVGWFASTPAGAQPWEALLASGATHAIVHERAYAGEGGQAVSEWLRGSGAAEVGALDGDRLFELRR
jgi:hypothetical protein